MSFNRYSVTMAMKVKICGITRIEDGLAAANLGADAIGLVFYKKSPRAVSIEQAAAIVAALPPFICTVGLFVNASQEEVVSVLDKVPLSLLQFHGDETEQRCASIGHPYIKALRVQAGLDISAAVSAYDSARGILLDTYQQGVPGGTGRVFDWSCVPEGLKKPIILAGGLSPDNVAEAINAVRPYAVDVSGGLESDKGIKDHDKIAAFFAALKTSGRMNE